MIKSISYLDCCLPDYFLGSSNVVLAVPVHADTTYQELCDGIGDASYEADYDIDNWDGFDDALGDLFEPFADRMDLVVDFVRYVEAEGDEEDPMICYAYFELNQGE